MSKNNMPDNTLQNRKILVKEIIKGWDNHQILSYVNSSLERWYRESNIDFELDWNKEILKNDS